MSNDSTEKFKSLLNKINPPKTENSASTPTQPADQISTDTNSLSNLLNKDKPKFDKKRFVNLIAIILGILLIGGTAAYIYFNIILVTPSASTILTIQSDYIEPRKNPVNNSDIYVAQLTLEDPSEPKTQESPINGLLFTKTEYEELATRKPIAVIIDNETNARPQTGLDKADIVYETVVESGITRYMAIYWSQSSSAVGPIRSARQYYLEWLMPYNPLFVQDGCASSDDARVNACGNIVSYGILNVANYGAWRDTTDGRFAPHNEYISLTNDWDYAVSKDWVNISDVNPWDFKKDAQPEDRGTSTRFLITFWRYHDYNGSYIAEWNYDPNSNLYYRKVGGKSDVDRNSREQLSAKVVIVQEVTMTETNDSQAHLIIETIGSGNGKLFQDGKIYDITWKKDNLSSRTIYSYTDGTEVELNRGQIWIEALPRTQGLLEVL